MAKRHRGMTYEEIYGPERAVEEKERRRRGNTLPEVQERRSEALRETYSQKSPEEKKLRAERISQGKLLKFQSERRFESTRYIKWREAVLVRDNYTCQVCGSKSVSNTAHHIKSWDDHPDLRFDVDNGQTLCTSCHNRSREILFGNRVGPWSDQR